MNGAGAALGNAAAIFRAGQSDLLAYDPQERRVWFSIDLMNSSIDRQTDHLVPPDF
jgi:hypothetical protein